MEFFQMPHHCSRDEIAQQGDWFTEMQEAAVDEAVEVLRAWFRGTLTLVIDLDDD